jgi:uncharacterized protein YjeT (DUF2065 family)
MIGDLSTNSKIILGNARFSFMGYFLTVVGLICFLEGLPYFASPEKMRNWLEKVSQLPGRELRIMGGALMVLGLLLVYLGKRFGG